MIGFGLPSTSLRHRAQPPKNHSFQKIVLIKVQNKKWTDEFCQSFFLSALKLIKEYSIFLKKINKLFKKYKKNIIFAVKFF